MKIHESIKLPFTDLKKFLLGIIFFHPFIEVFFGHGFGLMCGRLSFNKHIKLPEWKDAKNIFLISIKAFVIIILYGLTISCLLWLVFMLWDISFFDQILPAILLPFRSILASGSLFEGTHFLITVVILLSSLFFNFVIPIILMIFVINNNLNKAFAIKDIFKISFTKKYILIWLIFIPFDLFLIFLKTILPFIYVILVGDTSGIVYIPSLWYFLLFFLIAPFNYIYYTIFYSLIGQVARESGYKVVKKKLKYSDRL